MRNTQQHQDIPRFIDLNMVKMRTGMGTTFIYDHMKTRKGASSTAPSAGQRLKSISQKA